jgi:uncharacterized protein (UPF0332 family)
MRAREAQDVPPHMIEKNPMRQSAAILLDLAHDKLSQLRDRPCEAASYRLKSLKQGMEITKANESLRAAEHCFKEGLYNSCVSRAYYSMYQAAQTALEAAGLMRAEWTHGGLQATFANELTRRRKTYSAFLARDLNVVQDLRHTADYRDSDVSKKQATRALVKAREFVAQIRRGVSDG